MNYMKILLLLLFCAVLPMQAQQMKKLTLLKDFETRLLQEAKNIESIESNFTQIKYLDVFDEKITSKGKFYYKKSNKICMDYAQPMNYLIVINNNQLKIVSDGKKKHHGPQLQQDDEPDAGYAYRLHGGRPCPTCPPAMPWNI